MPTPNNHVRKTPDDAQLRFDSLRKHINNTLPSIDGFRGAENLGSLVSDFTNALDIIYPKFIDAVQKESDLQIKESAKRRMINKFTLEWEIIFQLIANAKLMNAQLSQGRGFSELDQVVNVAKDDLGFSDWSFLVIPRLSRRFALTHFKYSSEFAALEVPFDSLNMPWEWSVIWHELGGRKVKDLKKKQPDIFRNILPDQGRVEEAKVSVSLLFEELITKIKSDQPVGSAPITRLRKAIKKQAAQPQWSEDWVEEVFEDSCSVLTFGEVFIPILENVLNRQTPSSDARHPDPDTRVRIAKRLLHIDVKAPSKAKESIEIELVKGLLNIFLKNNIALPLLDRTKEKPIHASLRQFMREFDQVELSSLSNRLQASLRLNIEQIETATIAGKKTHSGDNNPALWSEVVGGDFKKMLEIKLSDTDFHTPDSHIRDHHGPSGLSTADIRYSTDHGEHSHYHVFN